MILYDLKCKSGHVFEAWFKDSSTYDAQNAAHELECPQCGTREVTKAPMAPHVARHAAIASRQPTPGEVTAATPAVADPQARAILQQIKETMAKLREHVEKNCEYVGERFPDEARRIHYGEAEMHGIYGEASDDEAKSLAEEGIEVQRLAWLPRPKTN